MMITCFRIGLLLLLLTINQGLMASFSEHANYYLSKSSPLLTNTEKYHLQQALHKIEQQKYEHAWSELAFVLHYFPNHPEALSLLSNLSIKLQQTARAKRYFERALQLYPEDAPTYNLYGQFLMRNANYADASQQFKKAILLDNQPDYHYQLSLAYSALKNYAQAKKEIQLSQSKNLKFSKDY